MKLEIPREIEREMEKKGGWENISRMPEEEIRRMAEIMKSLSDEARLRILYLLYRQRACVCMLTHFLNCSYSKCSYHISKLKEAGLIKSVKKGNYIIYSLTKFGRGIVRHFDKYKPEEVKNENRDIGNGLSEM